MEAIDYEETNSLKENINRFNIDSARYKLHNIIDQGSFIETERLYKSKNILQFSDYDEKLITAGKNSMENEAVITGLARIGDVPCAIFILEPKFMMGTMGIVVGEKIAMTFELAIKKKLPVISISASGGARMQEGVFSLVQMAKTTGAVYKHNKKGLLYISVISDPTLGGVTASFASLGDIIIAEADARYGFTGKRIIEETTHEKLPNYFQTAQYAKEHGQVDIIVNSIGLRPLLKKILSLHY